MTDRLSEGYEPRWDVDFARGREGELAVESVIDGMANGRTEVKTDEMYLATGNVFIEHACRYQGEWRHSGIATTEADVWAFVLGDIVLAVPTPVLREVHGKRVAEQRGLQECIRGSHPTKGVVIPLHELLRLVRAANAKARRP